MDDFKERRGYSHLKEKALDRTMWRSHFGYFLNLATPVFRLSLVNKFTFKISGISWAGPNKLYSTPFFYRGTQ
jgi:hypothetical protein